MQTLSRTFSPERLFAALCATALLMVVSLATAPPSDADICKNFGLSARCRIVFGGEKTEGGGGGGGGKPAPPACYQGARDNGVPCENGVVGIWSNERQCYVQLVDPQPDPSDPERTSKDAKNYSCTGLDDDGTTVIKESFWAEEEPETDGPTGLQEDLETAVGLDVKFRAMNPGLAPSPIPKEVGSSLDGWRMAPVGLWVWMWPRAPHDSQWGPIKSLPDDSGYSVEAVVERVKWDMGDGTTKTCGKSVPFMPYMRDRTPTCGHQYKVPGNYLVRVTTYWHIKYNDASGYNETRLEFDQSLFIRIGENQVVNK